MEAETGNRNLGIEPQGSANESMKTPIITIYESASTDGYTHFGDGKFYDNPGTARSMAKQKHGGYAVDPIQHAAIIDGTGRFYLLKSTTPVALVDTEQARQDIAAKALAKLSPEEVAALNLPKP